MRMLKKAGNSFNRISDWINRNPVKFIAGTVIAVAIGVAGTLYIEKLPDGIPAKAEADGVITAEEESAMIHYLTYGNKEKREVEIRSLAELMKSIKEGPIISEYDSMISGLVNDFDMFLVKEYGGNSRIGEDLHIEIESKEKAAEDCNASRWYDGCYRASNSTIYLAKTNPIRLFEIIQHEIGHKLREMPRDNNYLNELPSQANAFYALLRLQSFSRPIGNYYVSNNPPPSINCVSEDYKLDEKEVPYVLGAVGFLVQANKAEGNLELALYNLLTAPESQLEKDTKDAISEYEDMCKAYAGEYKKFLEQPEFAAEMKRHMPQEEAGTIIDFLQMQLYIIRNGGIWRYIGL